jgi:hypothetical protein
MRNRNFIRTLLIALFALVPFAVFAQDPSSSTVKASAFQIQNLGTTPATVTIYYVAADGSKTTQKLANTIPAGGSTTISTFVDKTADNYMNAPEGFSGSVIVESDVAVAAIANLQGLPSVTYGTSTFYTSGASYTGFSAGASTINFPLITRKNMVGANPVSTSYSIQNVDTSSTTVDVTYSSGAKESLTIPAGASKQISQESVQNLTDGFVGSATAISTDGKKIVGAVQQEGNAQLLSYDAFVPDAASTTIAVPLLMANNGGSLTGLQIQNASSTASATVNVTYSANTATKSSATDVLCNTPTADTVTLEASKSKTYLQMDGQNAGFTGGCKYVGSATITADQPVVAIVNQVSLTNKTASAYEGFVPSKATTIVKVPLAVANNYGIGTAIQVQNVGDADTTVALSYSANTQTTAVNGVEALSGTPTSTSGITIKKGESYTFFQMAFGATDVAPFDPQFLNKVYVGSATVTAATGGKIIAIVNQVNWLGGSGDTLNTFNAFNQ